MTTLLGVQYSCLDVQEGRRIKKVTTSQDGGFVEEVENIWFGLQKHRKIEKVRGSQDDDFVGVLQKTCQTSTRSVPSGIC
jgi:hypothetical protein